MFNALLLLLGFITGIAYLIFGVYVTTRMSDEGRYRNATLEVFDKFDGALETGLLLAFWPVAAIAIVVATHWRLRGGKWKVHTS